MRKPTTTELAYIAGFVDGEGYVGYTRRFENKNGKRYGPYYRLQLIVTNTNYAALVWIRKVLGVGYIYQRAIRAPWRTSWQLVLNGKDAEVALRLLSPYLRIKAGQAAFV